MTASFVAACAGMRSGRDPQANRDEAVRLVREAAEAGADYVQTPEMTSLVERSRADLFAKVGAQADDPTLAALREVARERGVVVHIGSLAVREGDRVANRAFLVDAGGEVAATYDKIHLFDVDLPSGESWRESATYAGGSRAVLAPTPWGPVGLTICYDLRFAALYRALAEAGAFLLAAPACFTRQTGEAHWHVLQRARHRDRLLHGLGRARGPARGRARDVRALPDRRSVGTGAGRGRSGARVGPGPDRDRARGGGARAHPHLDERPPLHRGAGPGLTRRPATLRSSARFPRWDGTSNSRRSDFLPHVRRMIRYALACDNAHAFESWFASSDAYESLRGQGLVTCPACGSAEVSKQIMAPRVSRTDRGGTGPGEAAPAPAEPETPPAALPSPPALTSERERAVRTMVRALREHVTRTADYVGPSFADEARRMQSGETAHRPIYGEASPVEARELLEEGIEVLPLPVLPDDRN